VSCQWESTDCKFEDTNKCNICFTYQQFYETKQIKAPKKLRQRANKADKRMGSSFEKKNHDRNVSALRETESNMTINSGATRRQKGDENITGYVRVMEELKTQMPERAKGTKTFTIHREWLDKLHREALQKGFEFWYLVFQFAENDNNPYVIVEKDMVFNMIQNMLSDRKRADLASQASNVCHKEIDMLKANISALYSKIDYLEEKLKLYSMKEKNDDEG